MFWLVLSVICVLGIFVLFKIIDRTRSPLINSIVVNYFVAAVLGFSVSESFSISQIISSNWIYFAFIIGIFFVSGFYVLGKSCQKVGLSISTVISKMAVVIPILFSIIVFAEDISFLKILSIVLALISIFMCVYRKSDTRNKISYLDMMIPVLLFLIMGGVDAAIIYAKEKYVDNSLLSIFSASTFAIAFFIGFVFSVFKIEIIKDYLNYKTYLWGGVLGLINFGSIYCIFKALHSSVFANSVLYGIINISVVILSLLVGLLFFKEKMSKLNLSGVILAIFTVLLLSIIEI